VCGFFKKNLFLFLLGVEFWVGVGFCWCLCGFSLIVVGRVLFFRASELALVSGFRVSYRILNFCFAVKGGGLQPSGIY
jgi:hypothetical protein